MVKRIYSSLRKAASSLPPAKYPYLTTLSMLDPQTYPNSYDYVSTFSADIERAIRDKDYDKLEHLAEQIIDMLPPDIAESISNKALDVLLDDEYTKKQLVTLFSVIYQYPSLALIKRRPWPKSGLMAVINKDYFSNDEERAQAYEQFSGIRISDFSQYILEFAEQESRIAQRFIILEADSELDAILRYIHQFGTNAIIKHKYYTTVSGLMGGWVRISPKQWRSAIMSYTRSKEFAKWTLKHPIFTSFLKAVGTYFLYKNNFENDKPIVQHYPYYSVFIHFFLPKTATADSIAPLAELQNDERPKDYTEAAKWLVRCVLQQPSLIEHLDIVKLLEFLEKHETEIFVTEEEKELWVSFYELVKPNSYLHF